MHDTKAFTLKFGGKNSWFDCHHRLLLPNYNFRRNKKDFTKNKVKTNGSAHILTGLRYLGLVQEW